MIKPDNDFTRLIEIKKKKAFEIKITKPKKLFVLLCISSLHSLCVSFSLLLFSQCLTWTKHCTPTALNSAWKRLIPQWRRRRLLPSFVVLVLRDFLLFIIEIIWAIFFQSVTFALCLCLSIRKLLLTLMLNPVLLLIHVKYVMECCCASCFHFRWYQHRF